jgi:general secretion pathway protein L
MSVLRIYASLSDSPTRCQWALVNDGQEAISGEGSPAQLPRRAARVQLVIPAAQVLLARVKLPSAARHRAGAVLAFAIEDRIVDEPDASQVSWLGDAGEDDIVAVIDKLGLERWRKALSAAGLRSYEIHCETLLLPWTPSEWSLAWNGSEGFVRTGEREGAATDSGDGAAPPLSLRMWLEAAKARDAVPASIALYVTKPGAEPDFEAWTRELGVAVRLAGAWDWRAAPPRAGVVLAQERQRWEGVLSGIAARLRPAAWILSAVVALHTVALVVDWAVLAREQRALRHQMEARFRALYPDAVAVADPAIQMRRKLAEARHAAGVVDNGDFLPMIERVAAAMKVVPECALRVLSYESGRMTLELTEPTEAKVKRLVAALTQAGLSVARSAGARRRGGAPVVLTLRAP